MTSALTPFLPTSPFSTIADHLPEKITFLARTVALDASLQTLAQETGLSRKNLIDQHRTTPERSPLAERTSLPSPITREDLEAVEFMPPGNLSCLGKSRQPVFLAKHVTDLLSTSFVLKATEPSELTTFRFYEALMGAFNLSTQEAGLLCRTPAGISLIQSA